MTKSRDLANLAGSATGLATDAELSSAVAGIDLTNVTRIVPTDSNISVPGAPTSVSASPGDAQAVVSFVAPTDNGGSTILSYTVISSPGNIKKSGSSSGGKIRFCGFRLGRFFNGFLPITKYAIGPKIPVKRIMINQPHLGNF